MIYGLDLFSGGGGLAEGLHRWVKVVAYCEIERGAQRVLLSRMARGEIDDAPIWDDVSTLRGDMFPTVDIIAGGFPCQDISLAGNGGGVDGKRSGLVFEYLRLISECRPRFVFMENVPALTIRGLDRVLLGLHALGYDARWTIVSAAEVGAPHLRERIWILAHSRDARTDSDSDSNSERAEGVHAGFNARGEFGALCGDVSHANGHALRLESESERRRDSEAVTGCDGSKRSLAHSHMYRRRSDESPPAGENGNARRTKGAPSTEPRRDTWWESEPDVGRVADGVADRSNRLRVLGNGVVPLCAEEAFARLGGFLT